MELDTKPLPLTCYTASLSAWMLGCGLNETLDTICNLAVCKFLFCHQIQELGPAHPDINYGLGNFASFSCLNNINVIRIFRNS